MQEQSITTATARYLRANLKTLLDRTAPVILRNGWRTRAILIPLHLTYYLPHAKKRHAIATARRAFAAAIQLIADRS